jgi:hypothetical protein
MRNPKQINITQLLGSEPEKISLHISMRYIKDESNRWKLHIIVDEMTTAAELREAWGKIDDAREYLKFSQGTDPNWYSVALLLDLEEKKKDSSYGKIAMDMNFDTLVYLFWAIDESKGEEFAKGGWITFINHLQGLGIKNDTIKKWEKQGRAFLADGKLPWKLKEGPITARRITDALRQFKVEKNSNKVVITQSTSTKYLFDIRITALTNKYWIQAKDLIERWDPKGFKSYKERWETRTAELIRKSVEFSGLNSQ